MNLMFWFHFITAFLIVIGILMIAAGACEYRDWRNGK